MVTLVGTETDFVEMLDHLLQLDLDAVEAYDLASGQIEQSDIRDRFGEFKEDHVRHADGLATLLTDLGKTPTTGPAVRQSVTFEAQILGTLVDDKSILEALLASEQDTNVAYERALGALPERYEELRPMLDKALQDEQRHRSWLEERLAAL